MEPIKPPKILKYYQLLKMSTKSGINLTSVGTASTAGNYVGTGFFHTLQEAEHHRTLETLKDSEPSTYHIFELEFPNPIFKD